MNLKISTLLLCIFLIVTLTNVSHCPAAAAPDYNPTYDLTNIPIFNTTSVEGLEQFLKYSQVDKSEYDFDNYHCVNFSSDLINELRFFGFNTTFVLLDDENIEYNHLIVCVELNNDKYFIEPQTDDVFALNELSKYYNYTFSEILYYNSLNETVIW